MTGESSCNEQWVRELARILRDAHRRMDQLCYPPADPHPVTYEPDLTRVVG